MSPEMYAVNALRRLGRKLTSGEWGGHQLSAPEAMTVIARASAIVMKLGVESMLTAFARIALDRPSKE